MNAPVAILLLDEIARHSAHTALDAVDLEQGGQPVRMVLESTHESPTQRQRGYYRAVVVKALAAEFDYSELVMHIYLLDTFGPLVELPQEVWIAGVCKMLSTFTTSNQGDIGKMAKYLDLILHWADVDLNIQIPEPQEAWMRTPPPELEEQPEFEMEV